MRKVYEAWEDGDLLRQRFRHWPFDTPSRRLLALDYCPLESVPILIVAAAIQTDPNCQDPRRILARAQPYGKIPELDQSLAL